MHCHYWTKGLKRIGTKKCASCGDIFYSSGWSICPRCLDSLPRTLYTPNSTTNLVFAHSAFYTTENVLPFCYYGEGGNIRNLIHDLKYHDRQDIAYDLGRAFGLHLLLSCPQLPYDAIVPVPLHFFKLLKRGYNQSTVFAKGIASIIHRPVLHLLKRHRYTKSQTKFASAAGRAQNTQNTFTMRKSIHLPPRCHILLVDDVITTGATTADCLRALASSSELLVTVASIAVAPKLESQRETLDSILDLDAKLVPAN